MKVCLVHYNPIYPKVGLLDAYNEVSESYYWGFAALGHEVELKINCFNPNAINIVFGSSIPQQLGLIDTFPDNTIFVNLERYSHRTLKHTTVEYVARKYQIWDYSLGNIAAWNQISPKYPVYHAPIAYAPNLEKIPKGLAQDIDLLYYGNLTLPGRFELLTQVIKPCRDLNLAGMSVMTLNNFYGKQRDEFIARAKVVANFSFGHIFEIVRVSYLMANRKAVVSTYHDGLEIEPDMREAIRFVNEPDIAAACQALAEDDVARAHYAEQCYEAIRRRDIRNVIKGFFG